jgi:Uma2 family endonuclease
MAIAEINRRLARPKPVSYPSGDGKPMGETEAHVLAMLECIGTLRNYYHDRADVYVIGNNFIYYEEGNPKKRVSPDCYVVFGVEKRMRDSYFVWQEEGKLPALAIEITSRSTRHEDFQTKRALYEQWGVREYIQFDPKNEYLSPPLQGLRLVNGVYVPISLENDRLYSEVLGLECVAMGPLLRFFDPIRGAFLPTLRESVEQIEAERQRAVAAEEENRRLRAALEAALKRSDPNADRPESEEDAA